MSPRLRTMAMSRFADGFGWHGGGGCCAWAITGATSRASDSIPLPVPIIFMLSSYGSRPVPVSARAWWRSLRGGKQNRGPPSDDRSRHGCFSARRALFQAGARASSLSYSIGCLSGSCYGVARCAGAGNHAPSHAVPAIAERAAPTTTGRACAARTWSESSIGQERRVAATATSTAASPAPGPPDASRLRGPRAAPPRSSGSGRCSSRSPDQPSLNDACPSGRPPFFAGAAVAPGYPYPAYAYPAYPSRFPRHRASASAGAASTGTCSSGETRASPGTRSLAAIAGSSRARAATPSAPTEDRLLVTADAASRVRAGCPGPEYL